jgi:hypothetical protein
MIDQIEMPFSGDSFALVSADPAPVRATLAPPPSMPPAPRLPAGWERVRLSKDDPEPRAAADTEGLVHVNIDGHWMLYVPWFRDYHEGKPVSIAVLKHRDGHEVEAKIDAKNTITTPAGRKVGSRKWYH